MIKVLRVNKQGNRILSYTCTDGKKTNDITKDQLVHLISNKQVSNARVQIYKGTTIVRLTDEAPVNTIEKDTPMGTVNPAPAKSSNSVPTIIDYINKAKAKGIQNLDLSNIIVNTSTLEIKKACKKQEPVKSELIASGEAVYSTAPTKHAVNNTLTLEDRVKKLAESKVNYGVYCGLVRGKWGVVQGFDNGDWVVGLFNPDTQVFKPFYTFEDKFEHSVVIAGDFVVVFDLVYYDYSRTKVFKVSPNGAVGCPLSDEVEGFRSGRFTVNKLDNRFIMVNGYDATMIVDLDYMTISCKYRDSYIDILDPNDERNKYYIDINDFDYTEREDCVDLRVKSTFYEEKENYKNRVYSKDYMPTHMRDGCYIQFRVYRDSRGVKVTLHDKDGTQLGYDFEALNK